MGIRAVEISQSQIGLTKLSIAKWMRLVWRAAPPIILGVALWLALRWSLDASTTFKPSLEAFMADGGGGAIEVKGVFATEAYFRFAGRDPATLGMDPARDTIFYVMVQTHEHDGDLPSPATWWDAVSLSLNGQGDFRPRNQQLVFDSEHHQTVALSFQATSELQGLRNRGILTLEVPDLGDGARELRWRLPLAAPTAIPPALPGFVPPFLATLLPLLAGLLVIFSPCLVHSTTYYLSLFGGVTGQGTEAAAARRKMALISILFTLGFAIPYTVAGVVAGYAGQFVKNSFLETLSQPLSFVAGGIVLYLGLQVAGVLRLPFFLRLNLIPMPFGRHRTGYVASGFLGLHMAVGCLGCVGGSLFAALLLYSGTIGSPLEAGALLFVFALAANAPFFLAAVTLGRVQVQRLIPSSLTRYVPGLSGAILITLALLILSGTDGLLEDSLMRFLGLQV